MVEQSLPINIYRSNSRLMVATRAPGLEPENIRIELQGLRLAVTGALRGVGQARKPGYVQREWSVRTSELLTSPHLWIRREPMPATTMGC